MIKINTKPIFDYMEKNNLTKEEFCKLSEIHPETFHKITHKYGKYTRLQTYQKLSKIIGCPISEFFKEQISQSQTRKKQMTQSSAFSIFSSACNALNFSSCLMSDFSNQISVIPQKIYITQTKPIASFKNSVPQPLKLSKIPESKIMIVESTLPAPKKNSAIAVCSKM